MREAGIWYAAGGVQTDKTKESVVEFDKELKEIAGAKPISEAEFAVGQADQGARLRRSSSSRYTRGRRQIDASGRWGCR